MTSTASCACLNLGFYKKMLKIWKLQHYWLPINFACLPIQFERQSDVMVPYRDSKCLARSLILWDSKASKMNGGGGKSIHLGVRSSPLARHRQKWRIKIPFHAPNGPSNFGVSLHYFATGMPPEWSEIYWK